MTLEQHVPSLEICKQLKEAGYPQESFFYWLIYKSADNKTVKMGDISLVTEDEYWKYERSERGEFEEPIAAPLASELGEQLPRKIGQHPNTEYLFSTWLDWHKDEWHCGYSDEDGGSEVWLDALNKEIDTYQSADTEADARAKMWLYLKTNDLLPDQGVK